MGARLAYGGLLGVAVDDRESRGASHALGAVTVTPVARRSGVSLRVGPFGALLARVAPRRVEITASDGSRSQISLTDPLWRLRAVSVTLVGLAIAVTLLGRIR